MRPVNTIKVPNTIKIFVNNFRPEKKSDIKERICTGIERTRAINKSIGSIITTLNICSITLISAFFKLDL
jgi:hypothetical protein